jgi:thioredoxin 2
MSEAAQTEAARHIVCPDCLAVNRVPVTKDAGAAKCGKCKKPLFTGHAISATAETFEKLIHQNDIPVVVDFWAEWCGPCKMMAPVYEQAAAELEPRLRFLKVDTESEAGLAAKYGIRSIPTLMVFKKGEVAAHRAGASDAQSLRRWLRQNL